MSKAAELYPQDGSIAGAAPGGVAEVRERIARRIEAIEEQAPCRRGLTREAGLAAPLWCARFWQRSGPQAAAR